MTQTTSHRILLLVLHHSATQKQKCSVLVSYLKDIQEPNTNSARKKRFKTLNKMSPSTPTSSNIYLTNGAELFNSHYHLLKSCFADFCNKNK